MSTAANYEHISAIMDNFREFVLQIQEEQRELRDKLKQFPLPGASRQHRNNCSNHDNNNNNRQLQEQQQSHHHHQDHSHRQRQLSNNTNTSTTTYSIAPTIPTASPSDEPSTATTVSSGTLSSATATSGSTRPPPYKAVVDHNHNDRYHHHHNNNEPYHRLLGTTREQDRQRNQEPVNEDSSSQDTQQTQSPTPPVRPVRKRATLPATDRTPATIANCKHQHINSSRTMSSVAATTAASKVAQRGALIVLEGLDKVGKSTLANKLVDHLERIRKPVSYCRFPDRTTPIGGLIDDFLKNSSKRVDDHAMHLLFSANRWELNKSIRNTLRRGITVIVDRYSYSGIAYSCAKRELNMDWCRETERGLPKPDLVIYLELPKEVRSKRAGFGDERYENEELQELIRYKYEQLMDISSELWLRVDVENKSPDQVLGEIIVPVKHCLEACAHKELGSLEFL